MKVAILAAIAAIATSSSLAVDVHVVGARTTADLPASTTKDASLNVVGSLVSPKKTDVAVRVASKDTLHRAMGLLNKNTLATDNNIFIARSNIVFTQNDRLAMRKKVDDVLNRPHEQSMTTASLTKDVLRAVSAPDTDSALMAKASGVVAAKGDPSGLAGRIADFVDAVGKREIDHEQSIQSQTPRGVIVLVGTKDSLRQPTAAVNKNIVLNDNQIAISRSNIAPKQNDQVVLTGGAKVADVVLPASAVNVGQVTKATDDDDDDSSESDETESSEPMYRTQVAYPKDGEADAALSDHEQWLGGGFGGLGWGLGWRYPLGYWNTFGAAIYGGGCGLGFGFGGFYYC